MSDVCPCHGVPWALNKRKGRGGGTERQCRVRHKVVKDRYASSERGKAVMAIRSARNNPRRVFGASGYLGTAPRADQAADLNQMARDFRAQQKGRA